MRPLSCMTIVAAVAFGSLAFADDLSVTVTHPASWLLCAAPSGRAVADSARSVLSVGVYASAMRREHTPASRGL